MKKFIIGCSILFVFGSVAYASDQLPFRDLGQFKMGIGTVYVIKIVDPDNGNVCYVTRSANGVGITCMKP